MAAQPALPGLGCFLVLALLGAGDPATGAGRRAAPTRLPFERVLPGPVADYEVMQAGSGPGNEYLLHTSRLSADGFRMEGRRGRSCATDKPWLMVRHTGTHRGLAIALAYGGNWRIEVLPRGGNTVLRADTLPGGMPPFETVRGLPVPGAVVAEFSGDWDDGAQPIVRFIRGKLLRQLGADWPWVQYNTWYDRYPELDEAHLIETARVAAELGCELFVIDAGWYGQVPDWPAARGDWQLNRVRLPHGIEPIANEVRKLGMKFGMWVEIETMNPDLPVAKAHPDWFLAGWTLNFGKPEVLAWAQAEIDRIVTTYRLDYTKMDYNADMLVDSESYTGRTDPLWAHYRGLAALWDHMHARYPRLVIENCSSGSLRHDLFAAAHTDTHWVSDTVGNEQNLAMNFGMTYLFPPESCNHWTCFPAASKALDLQTCFTVTMLGEFGLSGDIASWDARTRSLAADRIALYKQLRPLLRRANVYHLTPQSHPASPDSAEAVLYAAPGGDRAALFAFQGGAPELEATVRLRGIDPAATYRVCMPPAFGRDRMASGEELIDGLRIRFPHGGAAAVIRIVPATSVRAGRLQAPTGLSASLMDAADADPFAVRLDWHAVSGARRYVVAIAQGEQEFRPYDEAFRPTFVASGLDAGTDYRFRVHAENDDGSRSAESAEANVKTPSLGEAPLALWRLPWVSVETGWGETRRNRSIVGTPLSVAGRRFAEGIGTHAPSRIVIDVSRAAAHRPLTFSALVGVDDSARDAPEGASVCVFVVLADGRELYRSPPLAYGHEPAEVRVAVPAGTGALTLMVDPAGGYEFDHADWIRPRLE